MNILNPSSIIRYIRSASYEQNSGEVYYLKKRFTAILSTSVITLSLLAPVASQEVNATSNPDEELNTERYGDQLDITPYLNQQAEKEEFQRKAKKKVKQAANQTKFNEQKASATAQDSPNFTYNGGSKQFLDRNLEFNKFTLRSVGEHVEIWVANDLSFGEGDPRPAHEVNQEQVDKLASEFDKNMYDTATEFFGVPDSHDGTNAVLEDIGAVPEGYYRTDDGDKIMLLVNNIEDDNYNDPDYPFFVAGFYYSLFEQYTDRNIITIDSSDWETRLEETFYSTTIHEFQHLIHDDNDSDETTWLNEGMSTFAEYLGGYGHDYGSINFLLDHPENSLVNWDEHVEAETGPETIGDYALTYLFQLYNFEQYSKELIREIAKSPENGIESYNQAYENNNIKENFQDVFKQFTTAMLIDKTKNSDIKGPNKGKYGFETIDLREVPVENGEVRGQTVDLEKAKQYEKDGVPAWGADYKVLDFDKKIKNISFEGIDFLDIPWETVQDPLGADNQVYWGNKADEADNNLILKADLTNVSKATLQFDNYIDIEEQWDFGMVQVSTDQGKSWTSLANENTRSDVTEDGHPKIKENVPGFTGTYDEWQQESFDLSAYAGEEIYISFRYLTDWASTQSGWFIDNIEIPEIGVSYDGSNLDGMHSKEELLEQYVNYSVTFVNKDKHGKYKIHHIDPFNITETESLKLKNLFKKGTNYMTTWYAAPPGKTTSVPFEYEVELKEKGPKKPGHPGNGKGPKGPKHN